MEATDEEDDDDRGAIDLSRRNSSSAGLNPPTQQARRASPQPPSSPTRGGSSSHRLSPRPYSRSLATSPNPYHHHSRRSSPCPYPNPSSRSPLPHSPSVDSSLPPYSPRIKDPSHRGDGDDRLGGASHQPPHLSLNHLHASLLPHHSTPMGVVTTSGSTIPWSSPNYLPIPQINTGELRRIFVNGNNIFWKCL